MLSGGERRAAAGWREGRARRGGEAPQPRVKEGEAADQGGAGARVQVRLQIKPC